MDLPFSISTVLFVVKTTKDKFLDKKMFDWRIKKNGGSALKNIKYHLRFFKLFRNLYLIGEITDHSLLFIY